MNTTPNKSLYIIFSSTPYRMGSFIRRVTKHQYNHVAISFDYKLGTLYSFARHHRNAPFYGGFVTESCLRYQMGDRVSNIKVCSIPLTKENEAILYEYIDRIKTNSEDYLYNMLSAILVPLNRKVQINNAYTCVEFAVNTLNLIDERLKPSEYYSIPALETLYDTNIIYEGVFNLPEEACSWSDDRFMDHPTIVSNTYYTFRSFYRLASRYMVDKY